MSVEEIGRTEAGGAACRQFNLELSAFLEGESRPQVTAHARQCPYCAAVLADLEQIRFASHHLPLEDPPQRVWANIRATLAAEGMFREPAQGWHRWLPRFTFLPVSGPVGALACLALLGVTLLLSPANNGSTKKINWLSPQETVSEATALYPGLDINTARTLREMEKSYLAREGFLEPTLQATYRKSLDSLDAAIQECRKHCERNPGNTLAREYLLSAYQSKAEVLASALEFAGR
jgi:hypothetical protein